MLCPPPLNSNFKSLLKNDVTRYRIKKDFSLLHYKASRVARKARFLTLSKVFTNARKGLKNASRYKVY